MSRHMRTTVRLPDDLIRRAKKTAKERNTTVTALLEQGLKEVLRRETKRVTFKMPPISKERSGVLPDI